MSVRLGTDTVIRSKMDPSYYYNMGHPKRGFAVIINHEFFADRSRRKGTMVDSNGLKKVLTELGFTVLVLHDPTFQMINTRLAQVASMDHSQNDCLVVAVLTHGELGWLCAKDVEYKAELIWKKFTSEACPSLDGKPRLFFIQACRGEMVDGGVIMTQTDGASSEDPICTHPDFLIARSSVPGYYSWRNTTTGSCFIQNLIKQLHEHGRKLDILTILTVVNRIVATTFESNSTVVQLHNKKSIPSIEFTLMRLLVLS